VTAANNALTAASLNAANGTVNVNPVPPLDPSDPANFQVNGVQVVITYPVQLNIPFTPQNLTTITLTSIVTMRQEF
jgi:hypothetical protein